jgi:hypothetical protein
MVYSLSFSTENTPRSTPLLPFGASKKKGAKTTAPLTHILVTMLAKSDPEILDVRTIEDSPGIINYVQNVFVSGCCDCHCEPTATEPKALPSKSSYGTAPSRSTSDPLSAVIAMSLVGGLLISLAVAGVALATWIQQEVAQNEQNRQKEALDQLHNAQIHLDNPVGTKPTEQLANFQDKVCP